MLGIGELRIRVTILCFCETYNSLEIPLVLRYNIGRKEEVVILFQVVTYYRHLNYG